jgi:hypothetical protein
MNDCALRDSIKALESTLAELSRMVGWSLDHEVLTFCLAARMAIARLNSVKMQVEPNGEQVNCIVKTSWT